MRERKYRYQREDFGELPVRLEHLTIYLNFTDEAVEAVNCIEMTAIKSFDDITLDANSLEILAVEWCTEEKGDEASLTYEYEREKNRLKVFLPRKMAEGERFCVRTRTRCFPSDRILEGLYRDATPEGAPQQYMSQCQQWGFQRIMPIFDDCRAKCTMTTTIEADSAYTHMISNGNIDLRLNPEGRAVPKPGEEGRQVITYENPVPMAPYLFLACVGTWDLLEDDVVYPSGRRVKLQYLVPPGATDGVRVPMEILKKSVLWIGKTQDYEYTGDTYRTICMNKSNFGGMENVGNTTIVTDAALIDEHTLDSALLYSHAVIVHEFEHNQCGSETTMETPFDVWLNEAYTVDVERQFMADMFDPSFIRLYQVDSIRNPLLGPLAIEDAGHAGRIVREGFNDPDELIDGVTYVKAAEVIRMLRLVLGQEKFREGKALYFSRYHNGNANTNQFFACFEEVSDVSLDQFKKEWLYRIGYPKISATTVYEPEAKKFRILFRQELKPGENPFHVPVELALVDMKGMDIAGTETIFQLRNPEAELVLDNIPEAPAFASINRNCSFYGTFQHSNATPVTRLLQVRSDPDAYNRVDAMRELTDHERVRLLLNPGEKVSGQWLSLYGEILADPGLPASLKAYFMRIEEQPVDRSYSTWYQELVAAKDKIMGAVNRLYREQLVAEFEKLDNRSGAGKSLQEGIEKRMLKQVLLELIVADDTEESHRLILDYLQSAATATEKVSALTALNRSSSPSRHEVLQKTYEQWHGHLSGYANYLRVVSSGTRDDVFEMIENEKKRSTFDITQPTWCRALFMPMATNNKMVWTDRGIDWVASTVIELSEVNVITASRLLNTFQHVKSLKPDLKKKVLPAVERILKKVSVKVSPTINGQAASYLQEG